MRRSSLQGRPGGPVGPANNSNSNIVPPRIHSSTVSKIDSYNTPQIDAMVPASNSLSNTNRKKSGRSRQTQHTSKLKSDDLFVAAVDKMEHDFKHLSQTVSTSVASFWSDIWGPEDIRSRSAERPRHLKKDDGRRLQRAPLAVEEETGETGETGRHESVGQDCLLKQRSSSEMIVRFANLDRDDSLPSSHDLSTNCSVAQLVFSDGAFQPEDLTTMMTPVVSPALTCVRPPIPRPSTKVMSDYKKKNDLQNTVGLVPQDLDVFGTQDLDVFGECSQDAKVHQTSEMHSLQNHNPTEPETEINIGDTETAPETETVGETATTATTAAAMLEKRRLR
eukprot:Platyproteum_vivax@DN282_c0_g1_i1.p1